MSVGRRKWRYVEYRSAHASVPDPPLTYSVYRRFYDDMVRMGLIVSPVEEEEEEEEEQLQEPYLAVHIVRAHADYSELVTGYASWSQDTVWRLKYIAGSPYHTPLDGLEFPSDTQLFLVRNTSPAHIGIAKLVPNDVVRMVVDCGVNGIFSSVVEELDDLSPTTVVLVVTRAPLD
jgi:hypothetical protein